MKHKSYTILLVAIVFVQCFYAFRFARDNGFFGQKKATHIMHKLNHLQFA